LGSTSVDPTRLVFKFIDTDLVNLILKLTDTDLVLFVKKKNSRRPNRWAEGNR